MKLNKYEFFYFTSIFFPLLFAVIFAASGCSSKKIIDQDKFVKIYADLIIAQDTTNAAVKNNNTLKEEILKRYNVTDSEYKETVSYYNQNPKEWQTFFNKVIEYIGKLKKKSGA